MHSFSRTYPKRICGSQGVTGTKYAEGIFDRILYDVPCSGDGTMRKYRRMEKMGYDERIALHRLQVQIAMRGVSLLKVGGLMVYSTCSQPVENEARKKFCSAVVGL